MATNWLELCCSPDVKFRIIRHFIKNPELRQNQTQIAKTIRHPAISVSRNIHDLVKLRILHEERHGKAAVYSLNHTSLLVNQFLTQLISLNDNVIPDWVNRQIVNAPNVVRKTLERVILFGSAARGELLPGSDIDLVVIVSRKSEAIDFELHSLFVGKGSEDGLTINLHVESIGAFNSLNPSGYLFNAKNEGIVLWKK